MAHSPKLEIFKFTLIEKNDSTRCKSFRDFFRYKIYNSSDTAGKTDNDFMQDYFKAFIKEVDVKGFHKNDIKKLAFTVENTKEGTNDTLKVHSEKLLIEGIIKGGKFGIRRESGEVDNKENTAPILPKTVISDGFFFLLYTPLNHNVGILMLQTYTEGSIKPVFIDFLKKFFSYKKFITCEFEQYYPKDFRDEFLNGSYVKRMVLTSEMILDVSLNGDISEKKQEFQVKIEIVDRSDKKTGYKSAFDLLKGIMKNTALQSKNTQKNLEDFSRKKVYIGKENVTPIPYDIDSLLEVKPTILLEKAGIKVDEVDGTPDFEQIKKYCFEKLGPIINEIMPTHAIEEL